MRIREAARTGGRGRSSGSRLGEAVLGGGPRAVCAKVECALWQGGSGSHVPKEAEDGHGVSFCGEDKNVLEPDCEYAKCH